MSNMHCSTVKQNNNTQTTDNTQTKDNTQTTHRQQTTDNAKRKPPTYKICCPKQAEKKNFIVKRHNGRL